MIHQISLYNTRGRTIEKFVPHQEKNVTMYTCGPTVYHYAHIGNLRSYIMEDALEKLLVYCGYDVRRVMNITDVGHIVGDADSGEDKMAVGARRERKTALEIAEFYTSAFFADCEKLNIKKPEIVVPATSCMDEIIRLVGLLLEKKYAYRSGGNVYFDTSRLDDYYVLTDHVAEDLAVGVRDDVEEDGNKRNKTDFVLWFTRSKFANQELRWDSPWGVGYPGWHIECSAIALQHLGEHLDLHCGGIDNIFPHHTNEITQSEAVLGHKWCGCWFHVQHLVARDGKMSKSDGDFLTMQRLQEKGYDPLAYRFFCLQSHYRKPLTFGEEAMDNAARTYRKLRERIARLNPVGQIDKSLTDEYRVRFIESLGDDLNTSLGVTLLYDTLKDERLGDAIKLALVRDFDRVLSLDLYGQLGHGQKRDAELEAYVERRIDDRLAARKNGDYALADEIRDELQGKGVALKDTREGTKWEYLKSDC